MSSSVPALRAQFGKHAKFFAELALRWPAQGLVKERGEIWAQIARNGMVEQLLEGRGDGKGLIPGMGNSSPRVGP